MKFKPKNTATNIEHKLRPLRDDKGDIISDYELAKQALKNIKEYQAKNKEPAPIAPIFVKWLENGVKYVDEGNGTMVDYKRETVRKQFDYEMIVRNTNERNKQLDKKGVFTPKVMRTIKGES